MLAYFTLLREAEKAPPVRAGLNEGILRSLGEGGYASEGSARRSAVEGATAVKPWGSTACLIILITLAISANASAKQKLVEVMFARDVVNSEPVGPFEPGAHCEKEAEPSGPVPVIDSKRERKVFFWNRIESSAAGILRHTWYKDDAKVAEVDLRIGVSKRWRTWSSKKIVPKVHPGRWKVVVSTVGEASEVICVAHFVIK